MPSTLPSGDAVPADGALPAPALSALRDGRPFGFYVHVPFCAARCGYCDFNTYTLAELGDAALPAAYVEAAIAEVRLARRVIGSRQVPVATVFFGGGTPTLLEPGDLGRILRAIDAEFGLAPHAEVTTEANPESVDARRFAALRAVGITRVSLGMQSARQHVLEALDRAHSPGRAQAAAAEARAEGFDSVSLDLIYGAPGESDADWQASLDAAVTAPVDHVSAYALLVEPGTRLAARVARGELPPPDDDVLAERYLQAEATLGQAGLEWYEVSNWARSVTARCRHNLGYWTDGNWWGVGPGAHSHVGGVRWWNVKRPAAYVARLSAGTIPAAGREVLTDEQRRIERIMLGVRLVEGHPASDVDEGVRPLVEWLVADGLLDPGSLATDRLVLTLRGRLLADCVVRALVL